MRQTGVYRPSNIPEEIDDIVNQDVFLSSLPVINEIVPVVGGVAHYAYRITAGQERFYLKIRGDRFAQIPQIACNPADIVNEYQALTLFYQISPENFPRVMSFNSEKFYMVLSDATPNGEKLETLFLEQRVTRAVLFHLGKTLRRFHTLSQSYTQGIREDDDAFRYEELLQHRFGYRHNVVLDELAEHLRKLGNRQLVLGDVSPKNIGINNDGELFIFFDLETAHKGDIVFDYAYLLGHIAIHTFTSPTTAVEAVDSYIRGYGEHNFDEAMVKRIALGIMLYRLDSIIPYLTLLSAEEKLLAQQKIEAVLPLALQDVTWSEVFTLIQL